MAVYRAVAAAASLANQDLHALKIVAQKKAAESAQSAQPQPPAQKAAEPQKD